MVVVVVVDKKSLESRRNISVEFAGCTILLLLGRIHSITH